MIDDARTCADVALLVRSTWFILLHLEASHQQLTRRLGNLSSWTVFAQLHSCDHERKCRIMKSKRDKSCTHTCVSINFRNGPGVYQSVIHGIQGGFRCDSSDKLMVSCIVGLILLRYAVRLRLLRSSLTAYLNSKLLQCSPKTF